MAQSVASIALHGGAGPDPSKNYDKHEAHLRELARDAHKRLLDGESAMDAIVWAVKQLEDSGLYIAGRGSSPNANGEYELDASLMDGFTRRAGAVAAMRGFRSPVEAARAVMRETPHVMLVGAGAEEFARAQGLERVDDPADYYKPASDKKLATGELGHGTVGAVAMDAEGHLAAATSTGGVINKMPGRVGDSPVIGAGTWADKRVAVSCTGQGEFFMRAAAAADVSARIRYGGQDVEEATLGALQDMKRQGGDGGMIAIDGRGRVVMPFSSSGLKRACVHKDGRVESGVF
ncbi:MULTISPECIES: isoaspartyl peptidase/L-asparaginase family protein [Euryhalocaulis]|uniref:isoaspartyl peptidase/L-asparaginase family protein n=1 Tax=Euryhalocaulis TaxID=1712422 RepID=UPI0003A09463|nr:MULTISPECIES: isoaspartyl peptidase/L-asparaginase [Euryhalocaulis]MBA4802011.1 isoaspartyl peptidase/L-asparaginase [Euryhalocaulis sp.]